MIPLAQEWNETTLYAATASNSLDVAILLIDRGANREGIDLSWMN